MWKSAWILAIAGALVLASGCFETEEKYTVNPDGSGKAVLKTTFWHAIITDKEQGSDAELKAIARHIIEDSEGVEAWKDISFKRPDGGGVYFEGTAYFKDINKLDFESGGLDMDMLRPSLTKKQDGRIILELKNKDRGEETKKPAPGKLTDEEVEKKVKAEKAKYKREKDMATALLGNMKLTATYSLPGTLDKVSNFKKQDSGSLRVVVEGKQLLKVTDELMSDDAWLRKQIQAGREVDNPPIEVINEKLFGEKAPVRATVTGELKPLFDYKAETAAAKKAFPEMLKKLGITATIPAEPAKGGGFKSLAVAGIRLVKFSDKKNDIRPFNYDACYTLALVGEFTGAVLGVQNVVLTKAVADNGDDLLPEREWDRKIHFPRLSKDKQKVVFEVNLCAPGEKVKGLKEVSGTLEYLVSSGSEDVDIGIEDFKPGAKGKKFGAAIESISDSEWEEGKEILSLKMDLSKDSVKSLTFYDKDSNALDISKSGYMSSGGSTTFEFSIKGKFPQKGRIVAQVFKEIKEYKIPFKVTDVSLTGQPLK